MKAGTLAVCALGVLALPACGGSDAGEAGGADTAVVEIPVPVTPPAPLATDSGMAAPDTADSTATDSSQM